MYNAELVRIMGELLLRRSADTHTSEAEDCFRRANELARNQGCLLWELRAALSLARQRVTQGCHNEPRSILAPVCARYTEGFGTADLRAARGMLELPTAMS